MSSLRAATVSNRVIRRKRKRTQDDGQPPNAGELPSVGENATGDAQGSDSASGDPGLNAADGTKGKKPRVPRLKKASSSEVNVECLLEWPQSFKELEKTHRALNLVFTFCCTRKYLATTFDTIKSAVETHTKKNLTIEDVAAIKALRPEGINFAYVDELMLQTDIKGAERDTTFKTGRRKDFTAQGPAPDASVGGITGMDVLGTRHPDDLPPQDKEVLYFEFIDGDLKRQVQHKKSGEPVKPSRKLRDEDLKMPVYSQKQMTSLIEKRNQKFSNAVKLFLNRCVTEKLDPELVLRQEAEAYIPTPSVSDESTPKPEPTTLPPTIPKERKSIPEIVDELKNSSWYTGQIVPDGHRVFEAQDPVYGELDFLLSQDMVNALYNAKGITQFYAHQAEAINNLHAGHHVVVSTSTSSGKSLIYQLPVLHALEQSAGFNSSGDVESYCACR